jgi:hypothetical protein
MNPVLDYATSASARPMRAWLPPILLLPGVVVWHGWPHLTPTGFPNALDLAMLALLAPGAFIMARYASLPGWVFVAFGASGVFLFLLANFHDNNFRRTTMPSDIMLPWSAAIIGGAIVCRVIGILGRAGA